MTKGLATKKRIGVLMGGLSAEREISIRSGLAVYQALQELGYNAVLVDAGKDIVDVIRKEKVKIAFLALHGGTGENGAIQGLLDVIGVPYTGSGVLASALAMDKEASKKIFLHHGLSVAPFMVVSKKSSPPHPPLGKGGRRGGTAGHPPPEFPLPWVVKPSTEGSSIGVSIVKEEGDLKEAVDMAFSFGPRVLIEKFIKGSEIHIAVLGDRVLGGVEVRPSLEFYNYEAKYTSGLTEYIIPPQIDETVYENTKGMALKTFQALGCSGAARVDFIVEEGTHTPYVLEVNTLPGMTTTSLLPKIAGSAGMDFKQLVEEILRLAVKEKE
ncbi:MAG: D-alanine--D-alanine ligase [Nitrospiraceae bacterium]|nr:MAG: D-alanine--D-alanine ligase [Nitrospiraceae bacterium]